MKHESTKTYGHEQGLSCAFRQWKATSHCRLVHGYALAFHFVFGSDTLDAKGWVVDFGGLKSLKKALVNTFDHTLAVASDDPWLEWLQSASDNGIADIRVFPDGVGCEKFAEYAFHLAQSALADMGLSPRVKVLSAECREHAGNSAIYKGNSSE